MARISAILNLSMCGSHGAHSGDTESQTKKICLVCCRNWGVATLPCHLLPQLGLGNPWTCMACHVRPPSTLVLGVWFLQSPCVWCAQMSAYMHLVHSCVRMPSWQALCSRSRVCRENGLTRHVRACMHVVSYVCLHAYELAYPAHTWTNSRTLCAHAHMHTYTCRSIHLLFSFSLLVVIVRVARFGGLTRSGGTYVDPYMHKRHVAHACWVHVCMHLTVHGLTPMGTWTMPHLASLALARSLHARTGERGGVECAGKKTRCGPCPNRPVQTCASAHKPDVQAHAHPQLMSELEPACLVCGDRFYRQA